VVSTKWRGREHSASSSRQQAQQQQQKGTTTSAVLEVSDGWICEAWTEVVI